MEASRQRSRGFRLYLVLVPCLWLGLTAAQQSGGLQWRYLVDETGALVPAVNALMTGSGGWRELSGNEANFGFSRTTYWLHARLPAELPQAPLLIVGNAHLDRIDVFKVEDGVLRLRYQLGDTRPFATRPWSSPVFVVPLQIHDAAADVVLRIRSGGLMRAPLQLLSADDFSNEQQDRQIRWAAALGALAVLVLLHGAVYLGTRRRIHLNLTCLIVAAVALQLYLSGYAYQLFWPAAPYWQNQAAPVLVALAAAAFSVFAVDLFRSAGKVSSQWPAFGRLWGLLCGAVLVMALVLPYWLGLRLIVPFGLIALVVAAVPVRLLWGGGGWSLKIVAGSWMLVCLGAVLTVASQLGVVAATAWLLDPQLMPLAVGTMLLSFAVLLREQTIQWRLINRQTEVIRRLRRLREQRVRRLETLASLRKQLQARELELKQLQAELAIVDGSSGAPALASRGMFDRKFRTEWQRAYRARTMLSLILFEIDGFDGLLALYGEQVGERCMNSIAAMIHDQFQRPSDLVARFGPGVVVVIAADTEQASALQLAENVRCRVESAGLEIKGLRQDLSVSAGIASLIPDKRHHEAVLLSLADDALYQARSAGGNRCICYRLPVAVGQREGD